MTLFVFSVEQRVKIEIVVIEFFKMIVERAMENDTISRSNVIRQHRVCLYGNYWPVEMWPNENFPLENWRCDWDEQFRLLAQLKSKTGEKYFRTALLSPTFHREQKKQNHRIVCLFCERKRFRFRRAKITFNIDWWQQNVTKRTNFIAHTCPSLNNERTLKKKTKKSRVSRRTKTKAIELTFGSLTFTLTLNRIVARSEEKNNAETYQRDL